MMLLYQIHVTKNSSVNTSDDIDKHGEYLRIIIPVLFGIMFVFGLLGNSLLFYSRYRWQLVLNNVNTELVTSLACVHLCFLTLCLPFEAISCGTRTWVFGDYWCKAVNYLVYVTYTLSSAILTLLSYDRYLAIIYPLSSVRMRRTYNMLVATICVCIVILIVYVPVFYLFSALEYPYDGKMAFTCGPVAAGSFTLLGLSLTQLHYLTFAVVGYVMPLSLSAVMHALICRALNDKTKSYQPGHSRNTSTFISVKLVFVAVLAFFLCWTPAQISLFLVRVLESSESPVQTVIVAGRVVALCLAYSSSCVNPVIYLVMSANFRQRIAHTICQRHVPSQPRPGDSINQHAHDSVTG